MAKKFQVMTDKEYWSYTHSGRNINGLIKLNLKIFEKAMCDARGVKFGSERILTRGGDVHAAFARLENCVRNPDKRVEDTDFQCVEYEAAELVKEAAEMLVHASKVQAAIRSLRLANKTASTLVEEKKEGNPYAKRKDADA